MVLEKTSESPMNCKEIKPVSTKGNQPWIFIGKTDAVAQTPILWLSDTKGRLTGKDPDAGNDWKQKEKRAAEDERLDSIPDSMDMNLSKLQEIVKDREARCAAVHRFAKSRTWLSNITETKKPSSTVGNQKSEVLRVCEFFKVKVPWSVRGFLGFFVWHLTSTTTPEDHVWTCLLYISLSSLIPLTSFCLFTIFITRFPHHPLLRFLVCQWPSMTCTDTLFLRAFRLKLMLLPGTNTEIKQALHPWCLVHSPIIKHLDDCKFPLWCFCSSRPFSPCSVSFWVPLGLFTHFWKHGRVCGQSLSGVQLIMTLWTTAHQAPLSMEFSSQECWGGLPFPSPEHLPDPGIKPGSPALQADSLPLSHLGIPNFWMPRA